MLFHCLKYLRVWISPFPTVGCVNGTVNAIARRVPGIVPLYHGHGCGRMGEDLKTHVRLLVNLCKNPNVASVLIVSLGCICKAGTSLINEIFPYGALPKMSWTGPVMISNQSREKRHPEPMSLSLPPAGVLLSGSLSFLLLKSPAIRICLMPCRMIWILTREGCSKDCPWMKSETKS